MSTLVDFLYLPQLWPPPEALELVRSTFVPRFPPLEERDRLIFVTRKSSQSRSIVNEQDVIRTLQDICGRTGLQLQGTAIIDAACKAFQAPMSCPYPMQELWLTQSTRP